MTRVTLLSLLVGAVCAANAQAATLTLWQDDDPLTAPSVPANLIVNTVDASVITSDPTRTAVGEVILTGASKFVSFNPGALPITPGSYGQDFTLSLDYFVPQGTTLDTLPDGSSPDLFWLQADANGTNIGASVGFISNSAAGSGWNTLVLNGTVPANVGPAAVTDMTPFFVLADGGFGAGTPNGTGSGVALYVDNVRFDVGFVPEPGSFALISVGALGLLGYRRR